MERDKWWRRAFTPDVISACLPNIGACRSWVLRRAIPCSGIPHQRAWERSPRHFERCSAKGGYAPAPAVPNIWYWCDKRTRWEGSGLELSVPPFRAAVRAARPGKHSGNKILGVTAATAELVSIAFVTKAPFFLKGQEPPHPARALQWANV
jgi:hypothetical protein